MADERADARAIQVLARALRCTNRTTRLRAVSMLSRVDCTERTPWLEAGCSDADPAVSSTSLIVLSWIAEPADAPWPEREDPVFDRVVGSREEEDPVFLAEPGSGWQWEYVIEIWREDGLLIGCYPATTCAEDDEHAKRIALGQAIIANVGGRGDPFDAASAAAFIVGKRRLSGEGRFPGRRHRGR